MGAERTPPATVRSALLAPETLLGLLGSVLLAVTFTSDAFTTDRVGWGASAVDSLGATLSDPVAGWGQFAGTCLVILAWWRLRPASSGWSVGSLTVVLVVWCLPLLLAPPIFSRDAVAYADIGWLMHSGLDPYVAALGQHGGPFAAGVDPLWARPAVYPPLALLLAQGADAMAAYDPYWSLVAQRLTALISVAVLAVLVPRVARRLGRSGSGATWFVVLSPLTLVHLVGGAHNDAALVALVVAAAYVALRWADRPLAVWVGAPALVGLAVAVKPQAILVIAAIQALPVLAALPAMSRARGIATLAARGAAGAVVALATFVALSLVSGLGFGWIDALRNMPDVITPGPPQVLRGLLAVVTTATGVEGLDLTSVANAVALAVALVVALVLVWTRWSRPVLMTGGCLTVLALGTGLLQPWHLALGVALLGLDRIEASAERAIAACLALYLALYSLLGVHPLSDVELLLLALISGIAVLLHRIVGRRSAGERAPDTPVRNVENSEVRR